MRLRPGQRPRREVPRGGVGEVLVGLVAHVVDPALAARDRDLATNVAAVSFVIGGALAATGVGVIVFGPSKTNVTGGLAPRNGGAELTVGATF